MSKSTTRKVVELEQSEVAVMEEPAPSPMYGVAMLKIAMELKKPDARGLDEILGGVLARMGVPEEGFRRYLTQNGGLLQAIARRKRY